MKVHMKANDFRNTTQNSCRYPCCFPILALTAGSMIACGASEITDPVENNTGSTSENLIIRGFTQIPTGTFSSAPTVTNIFNASLGANDTDVFAKGQDDQIWVNRLPGSLLTKGWTGWSPIAGGTFTSRPSATTNGA